MAHIFAPFAYGNGPRDGCWWDHTCDMPSISVLSGDVVADVAIIGGGFTGISAALRLASHGIKAVVLEVHAFGWGASGRNGGFCCLGGGLADDEFLDTRFGRESRLAFRGVELAAVQYVEHLIETHKIDVDRHSKGETEFAHHPKEMDALRQRAETALQNYGAAGELIEQKDLAANGMQGGPFYGAMTLPIGFGLNPRKYLAGLVSSAVSSGARLFSNSPAGAISKSKTGYTIASTAGSVTADQVIFATNGYSSENTPGWLAGRYMPTQSTVLVTRPLSETELTAQGWTTGQMAYDTRNLLHYFRLMPDRRFLFGMRGGLFTGARAEAAARLKTRKDFEKMFPCWAHVESNHSWSGFVCLARNKLPFVGAVPSSAGQWAAMCYHGNGVAMGSLAGKLVADLVAGADTDECPDLLRQPLARFPFGRNRRIVMPPLYAALRLADHVH